MTVKWRVLHLADRFLHYFLSNGLSFKTGSSEVLTQWPLLTISQEDLEQAFEILFFVR